MLLQTPKIGLTGVWFQFNQEHGAVWQKEFCGYCFGCLGFGLPIVTITGKWFTLVVVS